MIATEHFVYIHLHKSGGTFMNECLLQFFPQARQIGYHLPRRLIPDSLKALPVLGFVRNPWSYYVSWYSFQSAQAHPNPLFQRVSDGGTLPFKESIRNLLDLGFGSVRLDAVLARLPEDYTSKGLNLPRSALAPIRGSGLGFYSFLYQYMYEGAGAPLHLGYNENLRGDFLTFLAGLGITVSAELRNFVETEAARNISSHTAYTHYYDDELRDLVAERDRSVIEPFGYRFGAGQ